MPEECTAKNMLVKIADAVFNMRPLNYKQGASFEAPYIHSFILIFCCLFRLGSSLRALFKLYLRHIPYS